MLYHTALPSLYSSTELHPHTGTLRGGSTTAAPPGACCSLSSSYWNFLAELLLQWSGPPTVAVTNLFAVAVAGRLILILQLLPTLGLGVAGSCLVIVTSGCLVSVLNQSFSVYDSLVKFSLSVLCRLVLPAVAPYAMVATGTDRCARTKPRISSKTEVGIHPIPPQSTSADPLTTSFKDTNRFCFTAPNHGSYPIPLHRADKLFFFDARCIRCGPAYSTERPKQTRRRMELSTNRYCSRNSGTTAN
jgi:hypothetical protein